MLTMRADTAFAERREGVLVTAEHYQLEPGTTLLMGGAAFALYGLDTRINGVATHPFDVDAMATSGKCIELQQLEGAKPRGQGVHFPERDPYLPVDVCRAPSAWQDSLAPSWISGVVAIEGIPVPDLDYLIDLKMARQEQQHPDGIKDAMGLVQAQWLAEQQGLDIADHPALIEAAELSLPTIRRELVRRPHLANNRPWMADIKPSRFGWG
jgi:hypothetical protein